MNQEIEMARRQRDFKAREAAKAAARAKEEAARELADLAQQFTKSLQLPAGVDPVLASIEIAGLLELPEEQLTGWVVAEFGATPRPAERKPDLYTSFAGPAEKSLVLVPPGDPIPEGAKQVGSLAILKREAALRKQRLAGSRSRRGQAIRIQKED